jgi:ferric-dicitrate binding protein FerR (iron transport regulator)
MSCPHRRSLEDFAAGRLGADERRSLDAHLPSCPACREEAARLKSLRSLLSDYQPYEPSQTDWQRLDRKVLAAMVEAAEQKQPGWLSAWLPAFSLAAATAAVVLLTLSVQPANHALPATASLERSAAIALNAGADLAVADAAGVARPLSSRILEEGDRLTTGDSALILQTAPATGVRVAANSRLTLEGLATGHTLVRLDSGELLAEVKHLAPGSSFQVRAGDLVVSVRGTAFRVERSDHLTRVEVVHGLVSVERPGSGEVLLPGPAAVEVEDGALLTPGAVTRAVLPATETAFPLGLPDRALLDLSPEAPPMAAPPALVTSPAAVPVDEAPTAVALRKPDPRLHLASQRATQLKAEMTDCIMRHLPELDGCFEQASKIDPRLGGELTLAVAIDRTGTIQSVRILGATSPSFLECSRALMHRCEQPGTGEDEQIEIPLRLSHR